MVALLLALPILALLQYRWIGQVSQGDLERLQARLRADTAQFAEEFDADLQRVAVPKWSGMASRLSFQRASSSCFIT